MKKSLLFVAIGAAFVACAENEVYNEVEQPEILIGFSNANIGKKTKSGEVTNIETLQTNNGTMKVWGWKTVTAGTSQVFNNQQVTYNASSSQETTKWEYTPLKYWDMEATNYSFYAVSPFTDKFSIDNTSRIITGSTIEPVQVLADNNGVSQITSSNTTANDYLVADIVSKAPKGNASDKDVAFTFSHILSKLAVSVKTTTDFNNTGTNYPQIKLTNLSIKLQGMCPTYTQKTAGSVNANATEGDTWSGTAMTETAYTCFSKGGSVTEDLLLSTTATEIASYLVAPTATGTTSATYEYKVTVDYDIIYSADEHEHFTATDKTIGTLTSFVQNTNNTLTITIDPKAIYFDVETVRERTTGTAGEVTIE